MKNFGITCRSREAVLVIVSDFKRYTANIWCIWVWNFLLTIIIDDSRIAVKLDLTLYRIRLPECQLQL